jgi:hypothetical protein
VADSAAVVAVAAAIVAGSAGLSSHPRVVRSPKHDLHYRSSSVREALTPEEPEQLSVVEYMALVRLETASSVSDPVERYTAQTKGL